MKYYTDTLDFTIQEPSAVALGKFDGLHLGHKYLIGELIKSRQLGYKSVIFTFDIPPRSLEEKETKVLLTNREKEQCFSEIGIDYVIECPFTEEFKRMEPYEFLCLLNDHIDVKQIAAGTDFRFGYQRKGSYSDLKKHENEFGYRAVIVDKMQHNGEDISSTRIRSDIEKGDLSEANRLLGYPYFLTAVVEHGTGIGSRMGIPTVNQVPDGNKLLPPNGVYASVVTVDDKCWFGVSDIGCKPTISGTHPLGVETHIFDFDSQVYGREIKVAFLEYIRPELEFDSVEELHRQIDRDCQKAREICEK